MPCLQSKAKELAAKRKEEKEARESEKEPKPVVKATVKRAITISKPLLHKKSNGLAVRDVATQIKYQGDGSHLSLMEIDILNHTGCKWSRVIYPGFKGRADVYKSVERSSVNNNSSSAYNFISPISKANTAS